jgi:hypothetical protein
MPDSDNLLERLKQLICERVGYQEWKLRTVQWVAQAPTRAVETARKQIAIDILNIPRRTSERWLHNFTCTEL